jgi:fatty-acyl-CoA synthase
MGGETSVLDEHLVAVLPGSGQVGRLARSGHVPVGYRNDPAGTARAFPLVDGVRWAITNDLARVEQDGTITVLGRSERVINSGGEKIYPAEVEAAVLGHPEVHDAVVVAVPDTRFGEAVGVVLRLRSGGRVTLEELQDHCRPLLARFKLPRQLRVVAEIPRLSTGKVDLAGATQLLAPTPEPGSP